MEIFLYIVGYPIVGFIFIPILGGIVHFFIAPFYSMMEQWLNDSDLQRSHSHLMELPIKIKDKYGSHWHTYFSCLCYGIFWLIVGSLMGGWW